MINLVVKKALSLRVCILCLTAQVLLVPVFGLELSAGGGISLNTMFVFSEFDGVSDNQSATGFGIHGFADATYAQALVGFVVYEDTSYLSGSLMLKYPFALSDFLIFPLAGAEYRFNLDYSEASILVLKGGAGADIFMTDRLYLRPSIMIGYAFLSDLEESRVDAYENFGGASISKMSLDISASAGYRF